MEVVIVKVRELVVSCEYTNHEGSENDAEQDCINRRVSFFPLATLGNELLNL